MSQFFPGGLHPSNRNCSHWNTKGVIAYGSHNIIVVVDCVKLRRVQTVEHHKSAISLVRWCNEDPLENDQGTCCNCIASADISGQIIISDPLTARRKCQFSVPGTTVLSLEWYSSRHLIVLHSNNTIVLWNAGNGDKIWSNSFTYNVTLMSLDPFLMEHCAFGTQSTSILIYKDLSLTSVPPSNGSLMVLAEESQQFGAISCISYHKAYRNTLFASTSTQLFIVDTVLCAVLSRCALEVNLISILPCSMRDAVFFVHANGSLSLRTGIYKSNDERADAKISLSKVCTADTVRQGSQQRVVAASLCPSTQATLSVLYNSGRLVIWQLQSNDESTSYRESWIDDHMAFENDLLTEPKPDIRLEQIGVLGSLTSGVSCVRMRPMDELAKLKDDDFASSALGGAHLAAVGTHAGVLHLMDIFTGQIVREFNVQSSPIKCLEWGGAYTVLTAGYNHALSTTQIVRNDVFATDIRTGMSRRVRPEADESNVTLLRVSFYHCYLALAFNREPLEIWDLKELRLLRRMSRACPLIVDMSWSSKHHGMKLTESAGQSVYRENLVVLDSDNRLYHIVVKGLHVKDGKEVNTQWKSGGWSIRTMAWKDDILAMGDTDGRIAVWDLGRRRSRHVRASRMPVLRMTFSRLAGDHTLAVLHERELTLWDTEALTRIQQVVVDNGRAALDMDLCGVSPLLVTNDNTFVFAPQQQKNTPLSEKDTPFLMRKELVTNLMDEFHKGETTNDLVTRIIKKKKVVVVGGLDVDESNDVDTSPLYNEGLIRRFIGDQDAYRLLLLCQHTLQEGKQQLPPDLQLFWPSQTFREREMRVTCAACAATHVIESRLVERAVVAGGKAKERVVDRLIASSDLRYASMKAALLVSSQDSEQARSLIKLIATNLIASDMIEDGVELLFLVEAGRDACKYLQSQKMWTKSVVYAKMGLDDPDDIIAKWTTNLRWTDPWTFVLAAASRGEWPSVVEVLSSAGRPDLARIVLRTSTSSPTATHRTPSRSEISPSPSPRLEASSPAP